MATVIGLSSCESDDSLTNEPPAQEYIDKAKEILLEDAIHIEIAMKQGDASATAWGCDLTYDYVKINGDYRT